MRSTSSGGRGAASFSILAGTIFSTLPVFLGPGFLSHLWHYSTNGLIHFQWSVISEIRYNSSVLTSPTNEIEAYLFEIVFLGTSASAPSVHRGLSSQVVIHDEFRFLIDCGEGTQRQILQSGLGFKRLNRVLITHGHLDHILGLAGLLSTFMRWETIDKLEIYRWAVGTRPHL